MKPNPERLKRMRTDPDTGIQHTYGPYHEWVKTQPCIVTGRHGAAAHHIKSVKSGGRDYGNQVALSPVLHAELHTVGPGKFQRKYGVDLESEADRLRAVWDALRAGAPPRRFLCQCVRPRGRWFCDVCKQVIPDGA